MAPRPAIVIICIDGPGWCELNGTRHRVTACQVLCNPPGTPHSWGANLDEPWTPWWVHVDGPEVPTLLDQADLKVSFRVREPAASFRAVALDEIVTALEQHPTDTCLLAVPGAAWQLMALLCASRAARGPRSTLIEQVPAVSRSSPPPA